MSPQKALTAKMVMCHEIKNFCAGIGKKKSDDMGKYTPPLGEVYDGFIVIFTICFYLIVRV
jgi:hypothetical protein